MLNAIVNDPYFFNSFLQTIFIYAFLLLLFLLLYLL